MIQIGRFSSRDTVFYVILAVLLWPGNTHAQIDPLKEANLFFDQGLYHQAMIYLSQIDGLETKGPLLFKRGVCHYETNALDRAVQDFRMAWELGYHQPETDLYLGKIRLHQGGFEEAAEYFKNYLLSISVDQEERLKVRKLIKQCGNALKISYQRPLAIVENPRRINTIHNDFGMKESPFREDRFYFNSDRPVSVSSFARGASNIYSVDLSDNQWVDDQQLVPPVRSESSEILVDFTNDGQGIYFYRSGQYGGLLKTQFVNGKDTLIQVEAPVLFTPVNADACIIQESVMLFADRYLEGFGGFDLFYTVFDGEKWSRPVNMGPQINSPYDELSPFLSANGHELYFSSNRTYSVGGFDVFSSSFQYEANKWSSPVNLGIPINSPGDERYYRLSSDGLKALFSSNRKNALGGYDLYIARFKDRQMGQSFETGPLAFVDYGIGGRVFVDSLYESGIDVPLPEEAVTKNQSAEGQETSPLVSFKPLFYNSGQDVLSPVNKQTLDGVVDLLKKRPDARLEVVVNTNREGILEYNLYSSIKVGEKIEDFFKASSIADERILLKGFGGNYPLIKSDVDDQGAVYAEKYNRRVELRIHQPDVPGFDLTTVLPEIHPGYFDDDYQLYKALVEGAVSYKIQIAVVNQMYRGVVLDAFNDAAIEEHEETGLYAYTVGLYDTYAAALQTKRNLEKEGMTDVTIIPYVDGVRLDREALAYYVNAFPDLKNFMNYEN